MEVLLEPALDFLLVSDEVSVLNVIIPHSNDDTTNCFDNFISQSGSDSPSEVMFPEVSYIIYLLLAVIFDVIFRMSLKTC